MMIRLQEKKNLKYVNNNWAKKETKVRFHLGTEDVKNFREVITLESAGILVQSKLSSNSTHHSYILDSIHNTREQKKIIDLLLLDIFYWC